MTTAITPRIAGLADDVLRGHAPIATGRIVERVHPNIARLVEGMSEPATQFALHLDGGIEPVANAREAGVRVVQRAREVRFDWPVGGHADVNPDFPMVAALQGDDGAWYVARLRATVHGTELLNQKLAFYGINNGEPVLTRTAPQLRLASLQEAGFAFRHGVDEVTMRRPNFSPEGFLGDGYQPAVVEAHLARAREAMSELRSAADAVEPRRTLRHPFGRLEGADIDRTGRHRAMVHNEMVAAHSELQRLLPDEQGLTPVDAALRSAVQSLAADVEAARAASSAVPHFQLRETVDEAAWRAAIDTLEARVRAVGAAPVLRTGGDHLAPTQLAEFHALIERLQSGSFLTRGDTMRVFPYDKFGRTAAERMRNFGVAMEALDARVGFGDRGVGRLKSWMRDLAVDAAAVRRELPPHQRELEPLLAQVEEYAARNGAEGPVRNAQGVWGYEDFPDFAEVGRMGGSLRTFIAVDDAGRLAGDQLVIRPPAAGDDLLRW